MQPVLMMDIVVVLGVVMLALVLFVTERLPIDVTALLLIPLLSDGIRRTGLVQELGYHMVRSGPDVSGSKCSPPSA